MELSKQETELYLPLPGLASRDILKDVDEFGEVNIFCRIKMNKGKVQENKLG